MSTNKNCSLAKPIIHSEKKRNVLVATARNRTQSGKGASALELRTWTCDTKSQRNDWLWSYEHGLGHEFRSRTAEESELSEFSDSSDQNILAHLTKKSYHFQVVEKF
jgi:hypothetical protein